MKDNFVDFLVAMGVIIMAVMLVGAIYNIGKKAAQVEAVQNKVAYYTATANGEVEFHWATNNVK